ncbi:sporulation protein RMD1 [Metarhizium album ARSEF 1941]|uniref:Sporulation protein RMD1 n=1 Tax=Metarhizium album (strain ARSEF 1941) TaxID=1081103 RepID=A0A0B2X198_METAS|nr:sporulation protein RMD1 [Metarhizium album ARSEF 1941]KHN99447.1 sporulation protein RMD1 [Metarhizium album ARSEF 1941]
MEPQVICENTPLIPATPPTPPTAPTCPPSETRPRSARTVTFSPDPVTKTFEPDSYSPRGSASSASNPHAGPPRVNPPVLSALNKKLGRHNHHGSVPPATIQPYLGSKIGPQRSTKKTEKLKLLPNTDFEDGVDDQESGRDVYSQYTRIKDPTARRDAARLGKSDRDRLPRVTAYCTADKYHMESLMRFLKGRGKARGANPKIIDECIYTPYSYTKPSRIHHDPVRSYQRRHSTGSETMEDETQRHLQSHDSGYGDEFPGNNIPDPGHLGNESLLGPAVTEEAPAAEDMLDFDTQVHTPELFLFDYGVVVIWGMTESQETKFLKELAKFELEKLAPDDVETERFNFYYTREYQARIYNDFITLRDKNNYMIKLAISHALAQSVKVMPISPSVHGTRNPMLIAVMQTSLYEELIATTVDTCKDIPAHIALTGKINLSRKQINMQIGDLFILRIAIHLNGSVLDTPELFWVEPQLEPMYQAVRSYLEMDQRVGLLNERLDVIADLLAVLKDQLSHGHGEKLEWIVIILIAMEIFVACINIAVDLWAGEI